MRREDTNRGQQTSTAAPVKKDEPFFLFLTFLLMLLSPHPRERQGEGGEKQRNEEKRAKNHCMATCVISQPKTLLKKLFD